MVSPGSGWLRVVRGSTLASCCGVLALSGHLMGGGGGPRPLPALVVTTLLGAAFVLWADRQCSPLRLLVAATGSQVVFHLAAVLTAHPAGPASLQDPTGSMTLGHLLAAALLAAVLARGESAVWRAYRWFRRRVLGAPTRPSSSVPAAACLPGGALPDRMPAGLLLAAAHRRRGPPRPAAA